MNTYIPSLITPGKDFSIGVYKPQRGPAYAHCTEGTRERRENSDIESFSYEIPGARQHRVALQGTNTAKNRKVATRELLSEMVAAGWITADTAAQHLNSL